MGYDLKVLPGGIDIMNEKAKQDLLVSALFHDVGKAIMRFEDRREKHSFVGAEFLKKTGLSIFSDSVINCVYDHHSHQNPSENELSFSESLSPEKENEVMVKILKEADSFDAGQRGIKTEKEKESLQSQIQDTRVISFFSYAKAKKGNNDTEIVFKDLDVFPLQFFSGPSFGVREEGYSYEFMKKYLAKDSFYSSLDFAVEGKSFENAVNNSLVWLREFSWFMPASTHSGQNKASLFEHSKNVAALTNVLIESSEEKPALLVLGDFAGIQDFIKTQSLKSESQKGFTKRSRGRSFLIQILTEVCTQLFLKRLSLTRANIVISAGGHFYLLAPNSEKNKKILSDTLQEINTFLVKYTDKLGLNVAWIEAGKNDFKPDKLGKLIEKLHEERMVKKKYERLLDDKMYEKLFQQEFGKKACSSCGFKGTGQYSETDSLCDLCKLAESIGKKYSAEKLYLVSASNLPKEAPCLELFNESPFSELDKIALCPEKTEEINVPKKIGKGFFYCFVDYGHINKKFKPESQFFSAKLLKSIEGKDVSFDFGFKPSTGTPELEEIARTGKKKESKAKIAHFKLDVDNLGEILKKAETISQLSTVSTQMLAFFGKKVSEIWVKEKKDEEELYTVFAGGDDLYLLGRYDRMFEKGCILVKEFQDFYNQQISVSGGFTLLSHAYPMNVSMGLAESEISNAKKHNYKDSKKNAVSIFGKSISWTDFFEVLEFSKKLSKSKISTSQIYNLMVLFQKKQNKSKKIHPFYYIFGRMKEGKKDEIELIEKLEKEIFSSPMNDLEDYQSKKTIITLKTTLLLRRIKNAEEVEKNE